MAENIVTLTDQNFDTVISSNKYVIIDTWAPWCAPCKMIAPHFERLAKEYGSRITFAKLNTDENLETTRKLRIMNIPTFFIFQDGEIRNKWAGADPNRLKKEIEKVLK